MFTRSRKSLAAVTAALAIGFTSAVAPIAPVAQAQNGGAVEDVRPDTPRTNGDNSQGCIIDWTAGAIVDPRFENPWSNRGFTDEVTSDEGFNKFLQAQHYIVPQARPSSQFFSRVAFATDKAMNDVRLEIVLPEIDGKDWGLAGTSGRLFGPDETPYENTPSPEGTIVGNVATYDLGDVPAGTRFSVMQSTPMTQSELADLTAPIAEGVYSDFFTITARVNGTLVPGSVEGCEFVFGYEDTTTAPGVAVDPEKIGEFNFPEDTEYSVTTDDLPEGWTAEIDPVTGDLTVTPPDDASPGDFADVTVTATLPDGTTETTDVRVSIPTAGGGSAANDRCIPTLLAAGIPLAFLIPIGLGAQVNIPGLDSLTQQVQNAIRDTNTQLQQGIGAFDPETAIRVEQFNRQFGPQLADAARGAGLVAAGLLALGFIADACQPGGGTSSGSSLSSLGSSEETVGDDVEEIPADDVEGGTENVSNDVTEGTEGNEGNAPQS